MSMKRAIDLLLNAPVPKPKGTKKSKAPVEPTGLKGDERAAAFSLSYLDAFGYLAKELDNWKDISLADIIAGVKKFQSVFGLKTDGVVGPKTLKAMEAPRCGCPDIVRKRASHANYAAVKDWAESRLPSWQKNGVTYAIADFVPGVSKDDQLAIFQAAFDSWCQYGERLRVTRATGNTADIIIGTGQGASSNFDGPGGTLAWAYLPNGSDSQLQMKFDLGETWITNPAQRGILLLNVAAHEFGHLLGLDHSKLSSALMAPYYNQSVAVPQPQDDIPRFQARYGVRVTPAPNPTPNPSDKKQLIVTLAAGSTITLDGKAVN